MTGMNFKKYPQRLLRVLFLVLFGVSFSLTAQPKVDRANLRYGFSPRIKRFSWATLNCRLVNPDPKPYNIEIRFVDANRGALNQKTVFSDVVYVPAETIIQYATPVMTEDAEEYCLEIFVDGKEIKKSDSFLISLISGNSSYLVVLNDSVDVSLGAFATTPRFKGKYAASTFVAKAPPLPWSLLKKAAAIVVVRPDFSRYPADSYQAILDYVRQGGNIIFSDPIGAMEASKTPLSVLLPVFPLRVRQITELNSLSKMVPDFKEFSKPVDFLETIPCGDGIDILKEGDLPVFRWKKFGLGTCRFSAVPILQESFPNDKPWLKILESFFAAQNISNNLSTAVPALDEMTGFSVPGLDSVRRIFLIFFILIIIPLGLGLYLKRTGLAWVVTGCVTVIFSLYILKSATAGHSQQKGVFVSFIEACIPGVSAAPGEGWYGIFSSSDTKISIKAENGNTVLSSIPPPDNIMAMFNAGGRGGIGGNSFSQPTEVKNINALPEISDLNLNANMSRQFYASYDNTGDFKGKYPELQYKETGFVFKPWKIDGGVKPYAAWLQFANGIAPLTIKDGMIELSKGSAAMFASDTTLQAVQNFIQKGWKHSTPALIMVENSTETMLALPNKIIAHGKRLTVLPVKEVSDTNTVTVPSQSVIFTPGDTSTRLVMNGNEIKSELVARSDSEYIFSYQLPPLFTEIKPKKVELDFQYLNEGANLEITPAIFIGKLENKKFIMKREVKASSHKGGKFVFTDVADSINAGEGFIALKIHVKRENLPMGERLRANKWSVEKMGISVTGNMPESVARFVF